ncbi:DNA repair protein rad18 [Viridothelium virens]|uniref:Postreplication repair E3 ubiquitin-protein ligase RAD18 n=1 Tax=Viridothelium virens TaxID=1048519 RepID=A0A6A6HM94_VIRVR|nr:DNA repair protein rad18 [Viridothelium virens]
MEKYDVSDPSDWLETHLTEFAPFDAALRCEVCKDYYNTPMITSCTHTFCSLCIRRTLAADGKCPICRSNDQASKLRRNGAMEELVEMFKVARPVALRLAQKEKISPDRSTARPRSKSKRKAADADLEEEAQRSSQKRKTRGQSRRDAPTESPEVMVIDNEEDGDYQPDDDLVPCPICHKRMKQEAVFSHLDHCEEEQEQDRRRARTRTPNSAKPTLGSSKSQLSSKPPERIAELSYGLLTEKALRKKLSDLGIPSWGSRTLLIKRHTEWVNLWNANADSLNPRSKRDLLNQLDVWERTQGGHALNSAAAPNHADAVMSKEFDGVGWAQSNKSDFDKLIAEARRKAKKLGEGQQESEAMMKEEDEGSSKARTDERSTNVKTTNESSTPVTAAPPPPYLKHSDSLERAKEKIHGSRRLSDASSTSLAPEATRPHTEIRDSVAENGAEGLSAEELFRAEERRASISSFSPTHTKGAERVPMLKVPEHPVRDVDGGKS